MKVAIVVQARVGSTRLPGKVLARVAGRPLLAYQLERLRLATGAHAFVVATTWSPDDDAVADLARAMGWTVVRGSEQDVLARYILAANTVDADAVVRSTGDCPLIDPSTVDALIERFLGGEFDHVEVKGLPDGMGAEITSTATLRALRPTPEEREHVTLAIRRRPEQYRLGVVDTGYALDEERWTVDTEADLAFITKIIEAIANRRTTARIDDILRLLDAHPAWREINAHVPMGPIDRENLARVRARTVPFVPTLGDL